MAAQKTPRRSVASEIRALARSLPSVEEGVACEGTRLEATTFRVGAKAFLFLREEDVRLKLGRSLSEAKRTAITTPAVRVGGTGWVTVDLADARPLWPLLSRWVVESHEALGRGSERPRSPSARPARGRRSSGSTAAVTAAVATDGASATDAYLARLPTPQRAALERLRRTIRATLPEAEECVSYQLPAFRHQGKVLMAFGATPRHCALHPMSPAVIVAHQEELARFDTSKGTIHFQPTDPLPPALIRKLVLARAREIAGP